MQANYVYYLVNSISC